MNVQPCPKCGILDWKYELAGTVCAGCGYLTVAIPIARQKASAEKTAGTLRERLGVEAEAVPDMDLFARQLAAEREHLVRLCTAMEERADVSGLNPRHPLSREVWHYRARIDYTAETIALLKRTQAPIACAGCHGIRGEVGFHDTATVRLCPRCNAAGIAEMGEQLARDATDSFATEPLAGRWEGLMIPPRAR